MYCTKRTVQDELLQYGMQYAMWNIAMNAVSVCDIFFDSNPLTSNGRGVTQEYAFDLCAMHIMGYAVEYGREYTMVVY